MISKGWSVVLSTGWSVIPSEEDGDQKGQMWKIWLEPF